MSLSDAEEWESWPNIALLALLLRFPKQIARFPKLSPDVTDEKHRLLQYGWELAATERDLLECVNELDLAVVLHREHLLLKKFAVVYHTDNFNVRVHKMRENVLAIVAIGLGLQPASRRQDEPLLRSVHRAQERQRIDGLHEVLTAFEADPCVKAAIDARHAFVHRYREEPALGVGARERYSRVPTPKDDALAEAVRLLSEKGIDLYIEDQVARLTATIDPIRTLRRGLFQVAARAVLRRAPPDRQKELTESIDPFGHLV